MQARATGMRSLTDWFTEDQSGGLGSLLKQGGAVAGAAPGISIRALHVSLSVQ